MPLTSFTWRQVNAWRLSQRCLSPRVQRCDIVTAATRTGGIPAQVMSAAELALWARTDGLTAQDVQRTPWPIQSTSTAVSTLGISDHRSDRRY